MNAGCSWKRRGAGLTAVLLTVLLALPAPAADADADALLRQARSAQKDADALNREREQRFLREKAQQAELLRQAEARLAQIRGHADGERARFDAAQRELAALKTQLQSRAGDYLQVSSAVREMAGEMLAMAGDSLISAQHPQRFGVFEQAARSDELPSMETLASLADTLLQQIEESGRVARFEAQRVGVDGSRQTAEVVRIGEFTAISDGLYLVPNSSARSLDEPLRQPSSSLLRLASAYAASNEPIQRVMVDPSRGSLLLIEGEKPSLGERIQQGGLVGYVILVIGTVGLLIALWQLLGLWQAGRRMRVQLTRLRDPSADNPLGRVLLAFSADDVRNERDAELLELRASEAVLREMPALERAQSILRLFSAVAPLLGLLGTVTGMILTFQTITVFGTGDPKLMAGGISQALVTTVQGLTVAIPLLFLNALLATRSRALIQILDEQAARLLADRLERLND